MMMTQLILYKIPETVNTTNVMHIMVYIYIYLYPLGTLSCETVQNSAKSCGCLFGDCFGILP